LRIAIDARPLAAPLTGIGQYTKSLVQRLAGVLGNNHEWFLYSDRPLTTILPVAGNVSVRTGNASGGSPGSLRWAQWEYVRWAKHDRIDTFWSPRHHLPLLLPKETRTVVTIHDLVWKRYPETMQRKNYWLERILMGPSIRRADHIIAVSGFTAGEITHFYPGTSSRTSVIHEAPEAPPENPATPAGIPDSYILFVGTLEPRKNLDLLLQAYAATGESSPALVIAGGTGWGDVSADQIVRGLGLEKRVAILGYVSDQELNGLYRHATALVMPSHYEGFGLPVVEAMRHGVPCIVSRDTALEEICGGAGILVDPRSREDISSAITRISDPQTRDTLATQARERAKDFSWDTAAARTLEILVSKT